MVKENLKKPLKIQTIFCTQTPFKYSINSYCANSKNSVEKTSLPEASQTGVPVLESAGHRPASVLRPRRRVTQLGGLLEGHGKDGDPGQGPRLGVLPGHGSAPLVKHDLVGLWM